MYQALYVNFSYNEILVEFATDREINNNYR